MNHNQSALERVSEIILAFIVYGSLAGLVLFYSIKVFLALGDTPRFFISWIAGILVGFLGAKFDKTRNLLIWTISKFLWPLKYFS